MIWYWKQNDLGKNDTQFFHGTGIWEDLHWKKGSRQLYRLTKNLKINNIKKEYRQFHSHRGHPVLVISLHYDLLNIKHNPVYVFIDKESGFRHKYFQIILQRFILNQLLIYTLTGTFHKIGYVGVESFIVLEFNKISTLHFSLFGGGGGLSRLLKTNMEIQSTFSQDFFLYQIFINLNIVHRVILYE